MLSKDPLIANFVFTKHFVFTKICNPILSRILCSPPQFLGTWNRPFLYEFQALQRTQKIAFD